MAARVLHFGCDDCYRVQVLERAGYVVNKAESLDALRLDLQQAQDVDAVVLSENDPRSTEQAADIVRRQSKAVVILFRRTLDHLDERKFDQIYSGYVPTEEWLARTAELIARSAKLREQTARPRRESEWVRKETQRLRARLQMELGRTKPPRL